MTTTRKRVAAKGPVAKKAGTMTPELADGGATPFDVRLLRAKLGSLLGKPSVSRSVLAEMLAVSATSVFNWEAGEPISAKNLSAVRQLNRRASTGHVRFPDRNRGGRPKKDPSLRADSRRAKAPHIAGTAPLLYANVVAVTYGSGKALLRFALALPGGETRAIADVLLPRKTIHAIRPQLV